MRIGGSITCSDIFTLKIGAENSSLKNRKETRDIITAGWIMGIYGLIIFDVQNGLQFFA